MWGSKNQGQPSQDVHASYADPRASLLMGALEQSPWTETVRLAATADKICAWLAQQPDVIPPSESDYTADWRPGTTHFRSQLLEVPPLDRKNAATWNASTRWRKQPHRLFIACLLSMEPGETEGIRTMSNAARRMAAQLDGEVKTIADHNAWNQALMSELKTARAISLVGIGPAGEVPASKSAEWDAIEARLTSVPMASAEKPDINGYREGERVRLVSAFVSEEQRYEAGHTGTILVTNTSPADVQVCRDGDLHEILMDGGVIIMATGANIEKIPGHAEVVYSADGQRVHVNM